MVGDQSYTFEALLPYFKKGVQFTPANAALRPENASVPAVSTDAYSSSGGPLQVSYNNYAIPFDSWMKKAFNEVGLHEIQDFVSGQLIGHQYTSQEIDPLDETWSSSETSYLHEALTSSNNNFQVYPNTLAKRIIFSSNNTATGVQVETAGKTYAIAANREVILSAGAFQSPQLLMVSGVGPASTLENLSIPVIVDRPGVGQNMWNHVESGPVYPVDVGNVAKYTVPAFLPAATEEYLVNKTGVLTGAGFDFIGWTKLPDAYRYALGAQALADLAQFPPDWPEIEYVVAECPGPIVGGNYALIYTVLVAPLSRGNVTIQSNDTADHPIINPNWLASETDQKLNIEAFKTARALFNTTAVRSIITGPEVSPGESVQTDEEILAFIQNQAATLYHASCTCKFSSLPAQVSQQRAVFKDAC
jgi:choline dehydrogenase